MLPMPLLLTAQPPLCCDTADLPAEAISFSETGLRIDLSRVPALARVGGAVKLVDESRKLNLIFTHPEKAEFVVLDRKCTHGGGPLAYSQKRKTVQCTCWGRSEFALDGRVVAGPAERPARRYMAESKQGVLVVTL
jgi:Rieske Fe-S protein